MPVQENFKLNTMEERKLISMVEFVFKCESDYTNKNTISRLADWKMKIRNYAYFLKRELQLGMFIACDKDNNVLEEPKNYSEFHINRLSSGEEFAEWHDRCIEYQEAKERILFEGFEITIDWKEPKQMAIRNESLNVGLEILEGNHFRIDRMNPKTIEDLIHLDLTLTVNAINKLT